MSNFEDKLRQLAEKATPGRWYWLNTETGRAIVSRYEDGYEQEIVSVWLAQSSDVSHISFNDPETTKLVADVIAAARRIWEENTPEDVFGATVLAEALVALDAHHAKREGK